ncbi:hypothetical protein JCM10207_001057 [Rhodosporidiobolus poonsookiae]
MESLLQETSVFLHDFSDSAATLRRADELARQLQHTASEEQLSSSFARLPQELLLRIAELVTPPTVLSDEEDMEAEAILAKEQHLRRLPPLLSLAKSISPLLPDPADPPSREELETRARLLLTFGRLAQSSMSSSFTTPETQMKATALCTRLLSQPASFRLSLLKHVLSVSLPPFFRPHPTLNPATGRVLSRPLGGSGGLQAWQEEAESDATSWRRQVGLGGVVQIVVEALQPGEVEDLWPFLLPPVLTYLDDYETKNRVIGIWILDSLLDRVDASLLRRTGVGKVFEKSLESCFSALSDPLSPTLLTAAHPAALALLNLQHPPPSSSLLPSDARTAAAADRARFDALCTLLTASVFHTWEFTSSHVALETVSARALPPLLDALKAGSVRYLQILVPHLCEVLAATATNAGGTWTVETVRMMGAAAVALESVVKNGRLRIARWEGKVVGAVAQVWVGLKESDGAKELRRSGEGRQVLEVLEGAVKGVLVALEDARDEKAEGGLVERLRQKDPIFAGLVPIQPQSAAPVAV